MTQQSLLVPRGQRWKVAMARLRPFLLVTALLVAFGPALAGWVGITLPGPLEGVFWLLFVLGMAGMFLPWLAVDAPQAPVGLPVRGRWLALNSPTSKVPSHGTLAYGQSHAIDLVADPEDGSRPVFGTGSGFQRPEQFPAFGAPCFARSTGSW